jgi:phosphopantetheine adenylyltransferase
MVGVFFYLHTQNKTAQVEGGFVLVLMDDVGEQSHKSRSFDCFSKLALILSSDACATARKHSSVRVQESLEDISILVVDVLDAILGKETLFRHVSGLKWIIIFSIDSQN